MAELIGMGVVALLAVMPWWRARQPSRWPLLLPVVSGALWIEYEYRLSTHVSDVLIRVDIPLVVLMFAITVLGTAAWQIVLRGNRQDGH